MMRTNPVPVRAAQAETRAVVKDSPNDKRRKSAQAFIVRVLILVTFIAGVAYLAWFSRWAQPIRTIKVETVNN